MFACNAAALALGVRPGMTLSSAWAMAPGLRILPRDPQIEHEALESVAAWLARFTPRVTLEPPQQLAAEMGGSLRFFGGLDALERRLDEGIAQLGFTARRAWSRTARAALWRAAGGGLALEALALEATGAGAEALGLLRDLGIETVGQLMALPREGAARRLGQVLFDDLDRALGRIPEPRAWFAPPANFAAQLELPAPVGEAPGVLFAARRLLAQLEGTLVARQSGIRGFTLTLVHAEALPTRIAVPLGSASRDAAHFAALLRERLERIELLEPAETIVLEAGVFEPWRSTTAGLFPDAGAGREDWGRLIERIAARLGEQAVHGLALQSEHRPERAFRAIGMESLFAARPSPMPVEGTPTPRPLWLLEAPRPLAENEFVLLAGPERIESGWWDEGEVRRDYFIARLKGSSLGWVYRERDRGWFLHGIFA